MGRRRRDEIRRHARRDEADLVGEIEQLALTAVAWQRTSQGEKISARIANSRP
jgi:hypothetical protein